MFVQLMCCAVESNGWHLYRGSEWFKQFGARDDDPMTYEGDARQLYCVVTCSGVGSNLYASGPKIVWVVPPTLYDTPSEVAYL